MSNLLELLKLYKEGGLLLVVVSLVFVAIFVAIVFAVKRCIFGSKELDEGHWGCLAIVVFCVLFVIIMQFQEKTSP